MWVNVAEPSSPLEISKTDMKYRTTLSILHHCVPSLLSTSDVVPPCCWSHPLWLAKCVWKLAKHLLRFNFIACPAPYQVLTDLLLMRCNMQMTYDFMGWHDLQSGPLEGFKYLISTCDIYVYQGNVCQIYRASGGNLRVIGTITNPLNPCHS